MNKVYTQKDLPLQDKFHFYPLTSETLKPLIDKIQAVIIYQMKDSGLLYFRVSRELKKMGKKILEGAGTNRLDLHFANQYDVSKVNLYYILVPAMECRFKQTLEYKHQIIEHFRDHLIRQQPVARNLTTEQRDMQIIQFIKKYGINRSRLAFRFKITGNTINYILEKYKNDLTGSYGQTPSGYR